MRHDVILVDDAPSLAFMDLAEHRTAIRDWLNELMRRHGINSISELARRAGVGRNTIYRALDESDLDTVASTRTIAAISKAFDEPPPDAGMGVRHAAPGLADGVEATRLPNGPLGELETPEDGGTWRIVSGALTAVGVMPGDIVKVDFKATPQNSDVVCAQVYDLQRGSAETIFRLFEPPYLTTAAHERKPSYKPLYVDGERVLVRGVVVELIRRRRSGEMPRKVSIGKSLSQCG